jgi:O-antigen/teichoic acid export membrane protein
MRRLFVALLQPIRLSALRRNALLLLAGGVAVRLCGLVFIVILSRRLSASDIGLFSFAEAFADTLIIVASFSLDSVMLRRVASHPADAMRQFAPLAGFRLVSGPVYLLVILVASHCFANQTRWILPIVGAYTLLESASFCVSNLFIATHQAKYRVWIEVPAEILFTIGFAAGMWLRPALTTLLALSALRSLMLLAGAIYLARRRFGPFCLAWDSRLMLAAVPFLGITSLNLLQGRSETILLGFLSSFSAVGIYQLALRLLLSATFVQTAISSAVFPHLAADGLDAPNRRRLIRSFLALMMPAAMGAIALIFAPALVARIVFGNRSIELALVLRIAGVILPFRFCAIFLASALAALREERAVFQSLFLATLAGLLADVVFIPRYAAGGAAIGMLVSAAAQCSLHARTLRRFLHAFRGTPQPLPT